MHRIIIVILIFVAVKILIYLQLFIVFWKHLNIDLQ